MKRHVIRIWFMVFLLLLLNGCSSYKDRNIIFEEDTKEEKEEDVLLTFFGFKADTLNLTAIENMLHGFMDEHENVVVWYESIKGSNYWTVLEKRVNSGNMDDVIMTDRDHVVMLSNEHKLLDLSDLKGLDQYSDWIREQFTNEDGSVYFLPTCISAYGLYINYDLLEAHGQKIPTNFKEFEEVCDYFKSQGITPIIGNNYSTLRSLIIAKGFYPIYQKERPAEEIKKFNSGEADVSETLRPGFEMVEMMIKKGWFDCEELLQTAQTSDDLELFAKGDRPFMLTGAWASPRVKAKDPDFEFAIYPYPVLDDGSVIVMNPDTSIAINAESENVELAKQLVEYMIQKDVIWEYVDSQSSFTAMKDDRIPSDETIVPSIDYLRNGSYVLGTDYNLEIPLDNMIVECTLEMLNGMSADQAVTLLSEKIAAERMGE